MLIQATNPDLDLLPEIPVLSAEEIQTLDVHAALRMLGESTNILNQLNTLLGSANEDMLMAKIRVDNCKATIRTVKANMSALQSIVRSA